ncbi:hypothetical protein [Deinococcus soli (ex Cha et al. 2016)]|uniref:Uncharacterized protein n=1 Tax=Deinococcus soli (ex Cha et al. 2016) TaxID=1309411 RepID=A0ACC6KPL8_9DEIO|nr:hypothetical protein [Deinococcus soli (ex Cha et al. 2016)]MDR6330614.1 hypothetical protein [Deinococcus soli (ex Cha et al. 2016)]MDR6754391.1 hypothetical protein [Deinococcus soli (ex Cha et al. 2016)]
MTTLIRQLASFFRVPERVALLFTGRSDGTAAPVGPDNPLPVTGKVASDAETVTRADFAPQLIGPGTNQPLAVPPGANRAMLRVSSGVARMGFTNADGAPELGVGAAMEDVRGAQLTALRVTVSAGGLVRVDYDQVTRA